MELIKDISDPHLLIFSSLFIATSFTNVHPQPPLPLRRRYQSFDASGTSQPQ
jgi:hypothetical protein